MIGPEMFKINSIGLGKFFLLQKFQLGCDSKDINTGYVFLDIYKLGADGGDKTKNIKKLGFRCDSRDQL